MDISTLNNVAAQSATQRASTQLNANFDTFLTLLTTQLQNQDPLEPLDTEKFTEQLVQFSSVEQSIQTNEYLETLIALQSSSANETALAMIGKEATVNSNLAALGAAPAQWSYTLADGADTAMAVIRDSAQKIVAEIPVSANAGNHQIIWDGRTASGGRASEGVYSLELRAVSADGAAIAANVQARGVVNAAEFNGEAPMVEIAGQLFPVSLVTRVDVKDQSAGV